MIGQASSTYKVCIQILHILATGRLNIYFPFPGFQCCFQNNLPTTRVNKRTQPLRLNPCRGKSFIPLCPIFLIHLFICSYLIHPYSSCSLTTTRNSQRCGAILLPTPGHLGTCFRVTTLQALSSLMHPGGTVMWGRAGEL